MSERASTDVRSAWPGSGQAEDEEAPFKTLSHEEAQALRAKHPPVSPWRVIAAQAAVGLGVAALIGLVTQRSELAWSAFYGAAAVVVPGALLARGITRLTGAGVGAAAFSFMLWEAVKVGLAVAMLAAAAKVVPGLSWPALLVTMLVCMKVNWLALLWQGRVKNKAGRD